MIVHHRPQPTIKQRLIKAKILCLAIILSLSGCGGGGGGGSSDESPVAPTSNSLLARCTDPTRPLRIMPLGDSITESRSGYSSYRFELSNRLLERGCTFDFVGSRRGVSTGTRDSAQVAPAQPGFDQDHEGHWDYRADEIASRIASWAGSAQPDVVLLHIGSNDIFQGQSPANTLTDLGNIIETLQQINPQVTVFVAQVIPANRDTQDLNNYNANIPGLAAALTTPDSPVIVVNHTAGFDPAVHTFDGIHPNRAGEQVMASTWAQAFFTAG